jgi:hypothetical protein
MPSIVVSRIKSSAQGSLVWSITRTDQWSVSSTQIARNGVPSMFIG